eukprot:Gb_11243 [translate_table: standard]
MICSYQLQYSSRESSLKGFVVSRWPNWWTHNILSSNFEITIPKLRIVKNQARNNWLSYDPLPRSLSHSNLINGINAHHMNNI